MHENYPWYSFLYRLAGPQGTFWLWIISLLGIWLQFEDTWLTLVNRKPHRRSVADVSSDQGIWRRWVELEGVEIRDARRLMGQRGHSGAPLRLLLDGSDPAAVRWARLKILVKKMEDPKTAEFAKEQFEELRSTFLQERDKYQPWRPVIVFEEGSVAPVTSQTHLAKPIAVLKEQDPFKALDMQHQEAKHLVDSLVFPQVLFRGVLDETPQIKVTRTSKELGLALSPRTLRLNRKPSKRALVIFGLCSLLLLFLAAGLQGVLKLDESVSLGPLDGGRSGSASDSRPDPPALEPHRGT